MSNLLLVPKLREAAKDIEARLTVLREVDQAYSKLIAKVHAQRYANRELINELEEQRKRITGE